MDTLPPELLVMVLKLGPARQALGFRGVSKKYQLALTPSAFHTVFLNYTPRSFENCVSISKSPTLRQHVRCVVYEGSAMLPMSREDWEKYIMLPGMDDEKTTKLKFPDMKFSEQGYEDVDDDPVPFSSSGYEVSKMYTPEALDLGYQKYQSLVEEVKYLTLVRLDYSSLAASFSRFSNLEDVRLYTDASGCTTSHLSVIGSTIKDTLIDTDLIPSRKIDRPDNERMERQVGSLILALSVSSVKLKHLHLKQVLWSVLEGPKIMPMIDTLGFENILDLHISISNRSDESEADWNESNRKFRERRVGKILKKMKSLRNLSLMFVGRDNEYYENDNAMDDEEGDGVHLSRVLGNTVWPLKSLEIEGATITPDYFVNLISRHSKSLQQLKIGNMKIIGGSGRSWVRTLTRIKNLRVLKEFWINKFLSVDGSKLLDDQLQADDFYRKSSNDLPLSTEIYRWFKGQCESPFEDDKENSDDESTFDFGDHIGGSEESWTDAEGSDDDFEGNDDALEGNDGNLEGFDEYSEDEYWAASDEY